MALYTLHSDFYLVTFFFIQCTGAQVVIAVRDTTRGTAAAEEIFRRSGRPVDIKRLDLADLANVRSFAASFSKYYDRLDVLINNAGKGGIRIF